MSTKEGSKQLIMVSLACIEKDWLVLYNYNKIGVRNIFLSFTEVSHCLSVAGGVTQNQARHKHDEDV